MLTIFNRRELITVLSAQKLYALREALAAAGIACHVKAHGAVRATNRARYGTMGLDPDAMYTYMIYVHRDDYDRAFAVIQPALWDR